MSKLNFLAEIWPKTAIFAGPEFFFSEKKNFFSKKIFFSEKKIPGPAKMAVFGHISAKKFNFDIPFFSNGQI